MTNLKKLFLSIFFLCLSGGGWAAPFLTREAAPLGTLTYAAGISVAQREDTFGSPEMKYRTVLFPFYMRLGVTNRLDMGFTLKSFSHRIKSHDKHFSGSATSIFVPELKWNILQDFSIFGAYSLNKDEDSGDALPVGQGNDIELLAIYSSRGNIPVHLNIGYVWRADYSTRMGVQSQDRVQFDPGDIFEAKAALEVPLGQHFSFLTETAYYKFGSQTVDGETISESAGDALDLLTGLAWSCWGWTVGTEVGFGLLDERYTSFDIERGSGDYSVSVYTSYRLAPWWRRK